MKLKINKAVFPVAGYGTRFLPATKAYPKEMLPIIDKPIIQFAVEEAIDAGITELIFVTNHAKKAIEDHFDRNLTLEQHLLEKQQLDKLELITQTIPDNITCVYVRQSQPLGLGHAVACAASLIGNEPFAVLLADDLIQGFQEGCLRQMITQMTTSKDNVLAIEPVAKEAVHSYGIIAGQETSNCSIKINEIVEKPPIDQAPSNLAVVGRYILQPEIFACLQQVQKGIGGEIQLTDAIKLLMQAQSVYGYQYQGTRFDCGHKTGYLKAILNCAKQDPELEAMIATQFSDKY